MDFAPILLELQNLWLDKVHRANGPDEFPHLDPNTAIVFQGADFGCGHRQL